jgi:hypothetical protein
MLKTFTVFNVQQIDGLPLTTETVSPEATLTRCRRLKICSEEWRKHHRERTKRLFQPIN